MSPSARKVLTALRAARAVGDSLTSLQLSRQAGIRFGARIADLREAGFGIERIDVPDERRGNHLLYRYRLTHDPERDPVNPG